MYEYESPRVNMEVKLRRDCEPAYELITTLERHKARRNKTGVSAMAAAAPCNDKHGSVSVS
jgi:hypothetical protein